MKKLLISSIMFAATALVSQALTKTVTDGNFVFEVDTTQGTAALLRLVDNKVSQLTLPRVANDGSDMYLVNELGNESLNGCSRITSLVVTNNYIRLWKDAFAGCTSLKSIVFQEGTANLYLIAEWEASDRVLLEDSPLETVEFYRPCSDLVSYKPFKGKLTLRVAKLGGQMEDLPNNLFKGCENLASVTIGEGITRIGSNAFMGCKSLTSLKLPSTVQEISLRAFSECSSLTSIHLPAGLKKIPTSMCYGCTALQSINVPEGVTQIELYAFQNCTSASTLSLPSTLIDIENSAFEKCTSLTEVTIPEGVTAIRKYAFSNCTAVRTLHLPSTLLSMGQCAFLDCKALTEASCLAVRPPEIFDDTFMHVDKTTCKLSVPTGSLQAYKSAPYWSEFFVNSAVTDMGADEAASLPGEWFTLYGVKLPGKPVTPGIYLHRTAAGTLKVKI